MNNKDLPVLVLAVMRKLPAAMDTKFSDEELSLLTPTSTGIRFINEGTIQRLKQDNSTLGKIALGAVEQRMKSGQWMDAYAFPPALSAGQAKRLNIQPTAGEPSELKLAPLPELGVARNNLDSILDRIAAQSESPVAPVAPGR